MGVSSNDIFGSALEAEPATPGSYGVAPQGARLPDGTRLGRVLLRVADMERSLAFYQEVLGLRVVERNARRATLAPQGNDRVLVELDEYKGARPLSRGLLGLYHFAILLPDRAALGRFVQHLADIEMRAGAGDHLVSEAFYLSDPDGLGIEVYADRPRATWQRLGAELMLATDPVDVRSVVAEAGGAPWTGMPAGAVMGHVHLHVGDLDAAAKFYGEGLGFDRITWRYPGALFLGAGGYHHHVGTNTWAGPGARSPAEDEAQLLEWTIALPSAADVNRVASQLRGQRFEVDETDSGDLIAGDPWGTRVRITAS